MKQPIYVLMLIFLISSSSLLVGCSTQPKIEYVDRIVYKEPIVPIYNELSYPQTRLQVWGDYSIYKLHCESIIDKSNNNLKSIYEALDIKKSKNKDGEK